MKIVLHLYTCTTGTNLKTACLRSIPGLNMMWVVFAGSYPGRSSFGHVQTAGRSWKSLEGREPESNRTRAYDQEALRAPSSH